MHDVKPATLFTGAVMVASYLLTPTPDQLIICWVPALFLAEPGDGVHYKPRLWLQRSFGSTATVASVRLDCDNVVLLQLAGVSMCFCETLVATCQVTQCYNLKNEEKLNIYYISRGSIGIAGTRIGAGGSVVQIPDGEVLLFCRRSRPVLGPTQPLIQWVPGLMWPGRLVDLSPLVQRLRMSGAVSLLLLYTSMG